jgi:ABC-type Mn2+/Zn2+ transport system ATPase subunit
VNDLIEFKNVSLGYGRHTVLEGVDLTVRSGERLGIVGPNGSGKTTLLRAMLGSLSPTAGKILRPGAGKRFQIGYVPQRQNMDEIFPLTVHEIVLMGRYRKIGLLRLPGGKDREAVHEALKTVGISKLSGELYRNLSGGQKQRCLIARAIVGDPALLVLDEPTADMDIAGEKMILDLIGKLHSERSLPVVMVSHVLNVILNHVDGIAVIREGRVRKFTVEELLSDKTLTEVYGIDLAVCEVDGKRIVMPRE